MNTERTVLKLLLENYKKTLELFRTIIDASMTVLVRIEATIEDLEKGENDAAEESVD